MKKNNIKLFYIASTIIWLLAIFWESAIGDYSVIPGVGENHGGILASLVHIWSYLILCFLFIKSFILSGVDKNKSIIYGFLLTIGYGATDEWHQFFVPGREMHFGDWLLDVMGALIVLSFYKFKIKK